MHATSAAGQAKNTTSAISSTFLITAIMVGGNLRGSRLHLGMCQHPQGNPGGYRKFGLSIRPF
jgi:hypothetical protein